tara:strand:+ start:666 stop:842 length:177 start_codon:yes stop_codon:yes gene_type:complete
MARDNKVSMPMSGGGLTRYFDEYKSKIEISPGAVIVLIFIVMIIMIFLHIYGPSFIGV